MHTEPHTPASAQRGFSLLEVLVAFTVLAISLGAVMQALSSNNRGLAIAARYSDAATLASSKLAEVGKVYPLQVSGHEGEMGEAYHWRLTIQANPDETGYLKDASFIVTAKVSWEVGSASREYVLSTLRNR
ncbi:MAG: prepilin-type N-terminal cleavage/methylation domain-containing protein [Candidatus Thiodiazotropha sp. (ex Epidulcina cf. delphinae)]|nr:prepilin-type N-terminal cleavage/methylation domain-containing protein [Candidatus Thiodiazotropha sp. (ex Epidulcina cf. delphinae)]